ncbi:MAG: radical SAM protein [Alistipes sp.]|nr:radical SAM protein [Alistipes sp.]
MSKSIDSILAQKSLFEIPLNGGYALLYAPLADSILLLNEEERTRVKRAIVTPDIADEEALSIVDTLCDVVPIENRNNQIRNENDFINLSILPNNICNFSCAYCYSAKGRSKQQLSLEDAKRTVDFFFCPQRNQSSQLTVSIFGGGEPLLSWNKVVYPTIEYIEQQAKKYSKDVVITLITNGSLIPNDFLEICSKYHIDLVCSFEILEDVQNSQRRHFELVSSNIRIMIDNGVVPAINSVITDLNVARQSEMIEALHSLYPEIKYVAFEPVISPSIEDKSAFYRTFTKEFIAAERIATQYEIRLTCSVLRNVDVTVDRYCPGEFALCANGEISICPCVSSPLEPNYDKYIYGQVDKDGVHINKDKLQQLLSQNLHSQVWCNECFAKWNCGGGCTNNTVNNEGKQDVSYCEFVKRFLKYTLLKRLEKIYIEESNENIQEKIGNYEYIITE